MKKKISAALAIYHDIPHRYGMDLSGFDLSHGHRDFRDTFRKS